MEGHLGIKLFERVRAGIELTEEGKILYRRIADAFGGIEAGIDEINTRATGMVPVTLSASTAFTMHWLLPRLHRFKESYPKVDLRLHLNAGRVGEPAIDVDLCVGILRDDERFQDRVVIMPETLIPVCSPRYEHSVRNAEDQIVETLLLSNDSEYGWHDRFPSFSQRQHSRSTTLRLDDYSVVVEAALQGQGIALGWLNVISQCLLNETLKPAEQESFVTSRHCSIVSPNGKAGDPVIRGVRDWIVREMRSDIIELDNKFPKLALREKKTMRQW